jgi:hypothetical protein
VRRVSIATLALCSALLAKSDLGATTCSTPPFVVIPGTRATAPRNTHIWIYGWDDADDRLSFELRSAPKKKSAGALILTSARRMSTVDSNFTVELVPKHDLAPKTRYEVWAVGKTERLVGTLRTGTSRDTQAPSWTGASKVEPIRPRSLNKPGARRVIVVSDTHGLRVAGPRATDAEGRVLYAAWKGEAGKPIDFTRPPDGYAWDTDPASSILVVLGTPETCIPTNFEVPEDKPELQIGLAAVDLAGNRGATSEHRVKL